MLTKLVEQTKVKQHCLINKNFLEIFGFNEPEKKKEKKKKKKKKRL